MTAAVHPGRSQPESALLPWFWISAILGGSLAVVLALLVNQPLLPILVALALPVLLAMLIWPDFAPLLVMFVMYSNAAVVVVKYHGVPFALGASVPLLLGIPIARDLLLRKRKLLIAPALLPFVGFFAVQLIGVLLSTHPEIAAAGLAETAVEGFVLYLLITNSIRTPDVLKRVVWALILAGAMMGALSTYQQFTGTFDSDYAGFSRTSATAFDTGEPEEAQPRLSGPIGEQNRFAQILAMLIPLALFRMWGGRSRKERLLATIALGFIGMGFALAFSRGAAVGLGLMFVVMLAMGYVHWRHLLVIPVAVALIAIAVPQYGSRLSSLADIAAVLSDSEGPGLKAADGATRGRVAEMTAAAIMFADHPLIGVGPDMYREHYSEYAEVVGVKVKGQKRKAHSLYLGLAAEHGLLGLLTFGLVVFVTFRDLVRARRFWQPIDRDLANIQASIMLALIVNLTTAAFLHMAYFRYFSLVIGLAGAASFLRSGRVRPEGDAIARRKLQGALVGRAPR